MQFCKKQKRKWRSMQKNANQTRDQLDKHEFGKNIRKPKKKSKAEKMQIRPDKHDFGKTNAKT